MCEGVQGRVEETKEKREEKRKGGRIGREVRVGGVFDGAGE